MAESNADVDLRSVSRDGAHSSYAPTSQEVAADAGAHVEQTLGAPVEAKSKPKSKPNEKAGDQ